MTAFLRGFGRRGFGLCGMRRVKGKMLGGWGWYNKSLALGFDAAVSRDLGSWIHVEVWLALVAPS